jgi:hypothetical protein
LSQGSKKRRENISRTNWGKHPNVKSNPFSALNALAPAGSRCYFDGKKRGDEAEEACSGAFFYR